LLAPIKKPVPFSWNIHAHPDNDTQHENELPVIPLGDGIHFEHITNPYELFYEIASGNWENAAGMMHAVSDTTNEQSLISRLSRVTRP